jgi:hypothetical protein
MKKTYFKIMVDQEIETNLNEVVSKNEEKDFDKIF